MKEDGMKERELEEKLVDAVKKMGGICPKWVSPGMNGMPDRIVILPSRIGFVEVKAPGKKPRVLQKRLHARLRHLGCLVYVLDDPEDIPAVLEAVREGKPWQK